MEYISFPILYCIVPLGTLQYVTLTHPNIAFCVNNVCKFIAIPIESRCRAVICIMCYLSGTKTHGLMLAPANSVHKLSL